MKQKLAKILKQWFDSPQPTTTIGVQLTAEQLPIVTGGSDGNDHDHEGAVNIMDFGGSLGQPPP